MANQNDPKKITLSGLGVLGINLDSEIEGMKVVAAKPTNRANAFQLSLESVDGKNKKSIFAGAKTIEEGLMEQAADGAILIAKGYDTFNQDGAIWARNKSRAQGKIVAV